MDSHRCSDISTDQQLSFVRGRQMTEEKVVNEEQTPTQTSTMADSNSNHNKFSNLLCTCCNRKWKTKKSLRAHLLHMCKAASASSQISTTSSECPQSTSSAVDDVEETAVEQPCSSASDNIPMVSDVPDKLPESVSDRRRSTSSSRTLEENECSINPNQEKTKQQCPDCGKMFVKTHTKCSRRAVSLERNSSGNVDMETTTTAATKRFATILAPASPNKRRTRSCDRRQCSEHISVENAYHQGSTGSFEAPSSPPSTRLRGTERKDYLRYTHERRMSNLRGLQWSDQQMESHDPKYLKLKQYHDWCRDNFDNLATMTMSKEIAEIVANPEAIDQRTDEDRKDPNLFLWSKDDESKLTSLTHAAKELKPPLWPWSAPDNTTQGEYNRERMEHVVKNELQYKILKCPACGITALLVGEEQLDLEQCIDCMDLSRKKPAQQQKLTEAWNKVRPKDEVPRINTEGNGSTTLRDLPRLEPSEQALIALVQPAVTVKRNYIANLKYKQESLNILQSPEKTWCKVLPRTDLHDRFVVIERRFRNSTVKYMVADPSRVRIWLQYLFVHHEDYKRMKDNNQLELSQEALDALEQQCELASVDYDESLEPSDPSQIDDTNYPPPSAELDSGLSTTEIYTFDNHETLYAKRQNVLKMVGDGKMTLIKEDDPSRKRTFDARVSTNIAFPHLYPNGEGAPTDIGEHTIARYLLKKQSQFAQTTSDGKREWRHAENGVHMMHEYARIVEMNVRALVGWYINQRPERAHIPIDSLLDAFREGVGEHGLIDTRMPELHGLMTTIRNSREKWFAERQMMEAMSRDFGDANLFFTLNMDARAWPDVRQLLFELEEGSEKQMPPDYYEKDTEKFTRMVDKYAVQLSIYLKHRTEAFSRAFLCDICRIDPNKQGKKTAEDKDPIDKGWFWKRVEFTSTRGIQHWHCVAKLPGVLDTSVLARLVQIMRVVRTELKFGNIKDYEKAWQVIEVGLLASRYLVLFVDSLSTCAFFDKEMPTDTFEESSVVDIATLRQEFTDSYLQKDITRKTHPIMRRFDDENCDENQRVEMAKVASVSCMHHCIANICGGDEKTGKGCRFQFPHKNMKYTVPALIQIDSERMELQVLPRRTCGRVPNLQPLFLKYYRGNHDFTVLVDSSVKLRYVSKYVAKTGKIESLLTEVIEMLDQKLSSLSPPSVKHALSNILLADCSHKAYMSKSELAYNVLDLPKVHRSFAGVRTVAFYPRATLIEECPDSEHGVIELSDRTEYSAYAERCRSSTEVRGYLTKDELENMNLRDFAESINYKWVKKANSKTTSDEVVPDVEPDDEETPMDVDIEEETDDTEKAKETSEESKIQWRCRDVRSGYWVMSKKRTTSHIKWSNPLYTDRACDYVADESAKRFSELEWDKRRQLERVYMELICYVPWRDNPDSCFLPREFLAREKENSASDPDLGCRYSLVRLNEYHRVYMEKWNRREIAPPGSKWHRDNQYSYTMYLASLHNRCVKQDRAANDGVFVARYEGDDELAETGVEVSPHVTTLNDADEYPSAANYLPYDILQEIQNQEPLKSEDLFVAFPEQTYWKDLKTMSTKKSSGLFMASPPEPTVDLSRLSPMQKLALDLIDMDKPAVKVLYIYGKAGSGKTAVAQFLCQKFRGRVQAAAGTGKAASNFNGPTIHGAFGWSADIANQGSPLTQRKKQLLQDFYRNTDLFIFDEINASPAYTLCHIDRTMRDLFSPVNSATGKPVDVPFGGKRVVFLGDSAQLRPIRAAAVYDKTMNAKLFGYKSSSAARYVNDTKAGQQIYRKYLMQNCIYLMQGHRNTGLLQKIMDNLRDGKQTVDDDLNKLLYQRQKFPDFVAKRGIHYSNESAMAYNCRQLWTDCKKLNRYLHVIRATYHMTDTNTNVVNVLSKIPASEFNYAQDVLCLAVGAEVRLITNLDTASGLVTNLTGTVVRILYDDADKDAVMRGDYPPPYCVVVKFPNFNGFTTAKGEKLFPFEDRTMVPIYRQKFHVKSVPESVRKLQQRKHCYREQFPVDLSGHLTAHRAQGQTFKNCTLDVNLGFESPQGKIPADAASITYVACSRINNLKDLFVSPIFPSVWEKMGHSDRDDERRKHEKELRVSAESFARKVNVYDHFLAESNFQQNYSDVDKEWNDMLQSRSLPCDSSDTMLCSDEEVGSIQRQLNLNNLTSFNPAACQRYVGIDQGVRNFSIVAIDKAQGALPVVVGAEHYDLQQLGLQQKFKTTDLILILQEHTSLFSWLNGDPIAESPCNRVSRVVVLVEQMSAKNPNHRVFNEQFGQALQRFFDLDSCVVKMSQPHNHRKNGPMFKLGEEIVKDLKLEAISYQSGSDASCEMSDDDGTATEQQKEKRRQYRLKKTMSSAIFKYFVTATDAEQSAMQVLVTKRVQQQWRESTVQKYDDLGDGLLHALNELLCGGSRYRQLIPTAPTLHRNRTVVLTVLPSTGYWVTVECYYNKFLLQDFGSFKTQLRNKTYKHASTVPHIVSTLPANFTSSVTEFVSEVDFLTPVDQIKVIVKQLKGFMKAGISGAASGSLTNATVEALRTTADGALPGGQATASMSKNFGWQYIKSLKETGQKIELVRSSGKHLNAVLCCLNWMRQNVPEFVRDRPLTLGPEGKLKFFEALRTLAKCSNSELDVESEPSTMEFIKLSPAFQRKMNEEGHLLTKAAKKILADLTLIALNNNSQYISAISTNYRRSRALQSVQA